VTDRLIRITTALAVMAVAVVAAIQQPDPKADAAGFGQMQDALMRSMGNDTETLFAIALRNRAHPQVNQRLLDTIIQQPSGS